MSQSGRTSDFPAGEATRTVMEAICAWWENNIHSLGQRPTRIVLAVSGGIDSVALLRGCLLVSQVGPWQQQTGFPDKSSWLIAHFNHQVRGKSSDEDAAWVEQLALREHLKVSVGIRQIEEEQGRSDAQDYPLSEASLRQSRYAFLMRIAREHAAEFILLAHHADDQVETVLHHLLRGTSFSGLAGMRVSHRIEPALSLERPLLGLHKSTLKTFLAEIEQDWREDTSNSNTQWTRNGLRQLVLPALTDAVANMGLHRSPEQSLLQLADHSREVVTLLESLADELLLKSELKGEPGKYKVAPWKTEPPIIQREAFKRIWVLNQWPRRDLAERHLERLGEFLGEYKQPISGDFPGGIRMTRRREWFSLTINPSQ